MPHLFVGASTFRPPAAPSYHRRLVHAAHLPHMDEHTIISGGVVDRLWTLDDLAAFLQVPKDTIRSWAKHGDGPKGYKVGRHVRFKVSDVESWLESCDTRGMRGDDGRLSARSRAAYDPESEWEDLA